jgi:cytochrome P450
MVVPAAIQLNPNIFEDPLTFNPWRWQVGRFFFPGWKKEKKRKKPWHTYQSPCMITQI